MDKGKKDVSNDSIQYLVSQLLTHIDLYLSNTEHKREAFSYILSLWYLASENKLNHTYIRQAEYNVKTDLRCINAVLYFKSLRDRYIYDNEEVTGRLLEEEQSIAYLINCLYENTGKEYYQDFCLFLLHNEKLSEHISFHNRFSNNDRSVVLQLILNWMKPNESIFNPMSGFMIFLFSFLRTALTLVELLINSVFIYSSFYGHTVKQNISSIRKNIRQYEATSFSSGVKLSPQIYKRAY